ncbi:hypothetical protein N7513_013234 [Penicillium frequentans]|nr:hypothetical protein N7513_013234 [Penicillium glabrum]
MKTMSSAVNFMAWWLDAHSKDFAKEKVMAYVGIPDLRYPILFFAAIKVGWTNAYLLREASVNLDLYADILEPAIEGIQQVESAAARPYMMVPSLDELAGTMAFMIIPTFSTIATPVWGPSILPPSGQLVSLIMNHITIRSFYVPPSVIEQFVSLPKAYEQAECLGFGLYGEGPLSRNVGHKLSQLADVCHMYGSIESGQIQMLGPQRGDWQYLELNPAEECDMQEVEKGSGLYEMVLHQDERFRGRRTLVHTFPDVKE